MKKSKTTSRKIFHEIILQLGGKGNMNADMENWQSRFWTNTFVDFRRKIHS